MTGVEPVEMGPPVNTDRRRTGTETGFALISDIDEM
jgi:hypothetical protein